MIKADQNIHPGFELARKITRQYAKTFYIASFMLDDTERWAAYSLYAICRFSDNSVDESTSPEESLKEISEKINQAYQNQKTNDDILTTFQTTINKYHIPKEYFDGLITGMRFDLTKTRYQTFSELHNYCYKVAGIVGLILLKLFGSKDSKAEQYAIDMGIAMQLTNILRDIKEDYTRGRVYLPLEELQQFQITEQDIARGTITPQFIKFMKFQVERARNYYQTGLKGLALITSPRGQFTALVMMELYSAILRKIERKKYNIFKRKIFVPTWEKLFRIMILPGKLKRTGTLTKNKITK